MRSWPRTVEHAHYAYAAQQDAYPVGLFAIMLIFSLFEAGLTMDQIIEITLLGTVSRSDDTASTEVPVTEAPTSDPVPTGSEDVVISESDSQAETAYSGATGFDGGTNGNVFRDTGYVLVSGTLDGSITSDGFISFDFETGEGGFVNCREYEFSDVARTGLGTYEGVATGGTNSDETGVACIEGIPVDELPLSAAVGADSIKLTIGGDVIVLAREP